VVFRTGGVGPKPLGHFTLRGDGVSPLRAYRRPLGSDPSWRVVAESYSGPETAFWQIPILRRRPRAGHPVSYRADLRLSFSRPSCGFFALAAIPAARSFAIRLMSFTGTGLVSGKWTVPFRSS